MKLIQVNAWRGRLSDPLSRFIVRQNPDIVCMQEAYDPSPEEWLIFADQYDFMKKIQSGTDLKQLFFSKTWGFNLAGAMHDEGNAILSRYQVDNRQSGFTNQQYHVAYDKQTRLPNTRAWQTASVTLPDGRSLSIANYHGYLEDKNGQFGMGTDKTVETMEQVAKVLADLPRPLIFCGDLNVWPDSPALEALNSLGLTNLSVEHGLSGTLSPMHRIPDSERHKATCDYIFVSPDIKVRSFEASEEIVSDHKALILEFEL